jgi:hypothetical protein
MKTSPRARSESASPASSATESNHCCESIVVATVVRRSAQISAGFPGPESHQDASLKPDRSKLYCHLIWDDPNSATAGTVIDDH